VIESASPAERDGFLSRRPDSARPVPQNLLNRGQFLDRLGRELVRTKGCLSDRFVVLCIDLDRFRSVTASLGRHAGDQLLSAVASRIGGLLATRDAIACLGGDEFAILIEEPAGTGPAGDFAERMQRELINGFNISGTVVYTTASIGIARVASSYKSAEDVLRDAEIAMFEAKVRGRARTEIFHPSMHSRAFDSFELESDLYRAVEQNEFELFFQPIVSANNGRVHGFESLLRWRHPSRGLLCPASFIEQLKETGLIVPVGNWVIQEACKQARKWQEIRLYPVPVTINIAQQQFKDSNVVGTVSDAIDSSGADPRGIILELTEDVIVEDLDAARLTLAPLRERGVRVMIDDFGTGYSSLSYIRKLSVDAIKLDASFVDRIERFSEDRLIVRAIIALAHALDLRVVAEGIEREEQLAELVNLECEEVQGYMISEPVDAETATRMIENRWIAGFASFPA
jgi:diguanylate cyclase (GGDEF) domain